MSELRQPQRRGLGRGWQGTWNLRPERAAVHPKSPSSLQQSLMASTKAHFQGVFLREAFPDHVPLGFSACLRLHSSAKLHAVITQPLLSQYCVQKMSHLLSLCWDGASSLAWKKEALGFPGGSDGKESACNAGDPGFDPWVGKISWRRAWKPTPVFLPGKSQARRSLVGYSPWGRKESDTID